MRAHCLFYAESHSIDKSNAPHIKLGRSRHKQPGRRQPPRLAARVQKFAREIQYMH